MSKKKNNNYTAEELKLLKESEDLIKELINQLKIQMNPSEFTPNKYSLPNEPKHVPQIVSGVYNGIGSIKTTCTGCRQRLFGD